MTLPDIVGADRCTQAVKGFGPDGHRLGQSGVVFRGVPDQDGRFFAVGTGRHGKDGIAGVEPVGIHKPAFRKAVIV